MLITIFSASFLLNSISCAFILKQIEVLSFDTVLEPSSLVTETSYIIFQNDSTYYARNGKAGQIKYSGTNITSLSSSVFNDLTHGRTFLEKVCYKGSFTVSNTINIPSYILLDLSEAKFTAQILSGPMFYSTSSNIEVYGGFINGNRPLTGNLLYGFFFNGSSNIKVSQTKIVNTTWETIYFMNCRNITLLSTYHYNSGREGVAVWNADEYAYENINLKIIGSTFTNCVWDGIVIDSTNIRGVKIESGTFDRNGYCGIKLNSARDVQIVNCQAMNNSQHGIYVQNIYNKTSDNISISNCTARFNNESNIHVKNTTTALVEACVASHSNMHGIWIELCNFTVVKGNAVLNNGQNSPSFYHGIYITGTENSVFANNVCTDNQTSKTQGLGIYESFACGYNIFEDNHCSGNYYLEGLAINGFHPIVFKMITMIGVLLVVCISFAMGWLLGLARRANTKNKI